MFNLIFVCILLLGAFLGGWAVCNIDFNYWDPEDSNKHWYWYFLNLYGLIPISLIIIAAMVYLISSPYTLPLVLSGVLLGYSPTGILYGAYDLNRKKDVWLAPNIYTKPLTWYLIHVGFMFVSVCLIVWACMNI